MNFIEKRVIIIILYIFLLTCKIDIIIAQSISPLKKIELLKKARKNGINKLKEIILNLKLDYNLSLKDIINIYNINSNDINSILEKSQNIEIQYKNNKCTIILALKIEYIIEWLKSKNIDFSLNKVYYLNPKIFIAKGVYTFTPTLGKKKFLNTSNNSNKEKQIDFWKSVLPEGKKIALRMAKIDAYRNLYEIIKNLKITPYLRVYNFIKENEKIKREFFKFIKTIKLKEKPKYRIDGVIEVKIEVKIQDIIDILSKICKRYYFGYKWRYTIFKNIKYYTKRKIIKATGLGFPPSQYIISNEYNNYNRFKYKNLLSTKYISGLKEEKRLLIKKPPKWINKYLYAEGIGCPPIWIFNELQARIIAQKVALLDARRKLISKIKRLEINNNRYIKDIISFNKRLESKIENEVKKAKIKDVKYLENNKVKITIVIYLKKIWNIITNNL